jgi:hypothetical protein
VIRIFGPNTQRVLAYLARLPDLSAEDIGKVTNAWWQTNVRDRAEAWVQVHRAATEQERYQILAAASVARQAAMDAASRYRWPDWAFWAAASDAGAAIAAGDLMGSHYETLISPLTAAMPWLAPGHGQLEGGEDIPAGRRLPGDVLRQGA